MVPSCTLDPVPSPWYSEKFQSAGVLNIWQRLVWFWSPTLSLMLNRLREVRWKLARGTTYCWAGCCWRCAGWSFLVVSNFEGLWYQLRWACLLWSSLRCEVLWSWSMWPCSSSWGCSCPAVQGCLMTSESLLWYTWCAFAGPCRCRLFRWCCSCLGIAFI